MYLVLLISFSAWVLGGSCTCTAGALLRTIGIEILFLGEMMASVREMDEV